MQQRGNSQLRARFGPLDLRAESILKCALKHRCRRAARLPAQQEAGILSRAFRRASRSAFLWPENVVDVVAQNRSLTELRGIGPFLEKQIRRWVDQHRQLTDRPPAIRQDFISLADARQLLATKPAWSKKLRGDLQMHTRWSDGSGTIAEMADAARERSYEYITITDHSKGLKIAAVSTNGPSASKRWRLLGRTSQFRARAET